MISSGDARIETIQADTEEYRLYRKLVSKPDPGHVIIGSGEAAAIVPPSPPGSPRTIAACFGGDFTDAKLIPAGFPWSKNPEVYNDIPYWLNSRCHHL